jgi:hypothetical protein
VHRLGGTSAICCCDTAADFSSGEHDEVIGPTALLMQEEPQARIISFSKSCSVQDGTDILRSERITAKRRLPNLTLHILSHQDDTHLSTFPNKDGGGMVSLPHQVHRNFPSRANVLMITIECLIVLQSEDIHHHESSMPVFE